MRAVVKGGVSLVMMTLFLSPHSWADEITIKDGSQAKGVIEELSEKRLILKDGGVGRVYWLKNVKTITIGDPDTGNLLTFEVESAENTDDISLPAPSYGAPKLSYESSVVQAAVSGSEIKLSSGQTLRYYGVNVPDDALAIAFNRSLIEGKKVDLHVMKNGEAVVVYDGVCVNARLLEEGMARVDKEIGEAGETGLKTLFTALEGYARVRRQGRWGLDNQGGGEFLSRYLSPEEAEGGDAFAYVVKGGSYQEVSWKKVQPPAPGIPFGSLQGCTVIIGSGAGGGRRASGSRTQRPPTSSAPSSGKTGSSKSSSSSGSGKSSGSGSSKK